MTAPEAKAKLEGWRDLLKAKIEGVTKRPWIHLSGRNGVRGSVRGGPRIAGDKSSLICNLDLTNWEDGEFFVLSSMAIPAMLAGIERILTAMELYDDLNRSSQLILAMAVCGLAEAYEPYFQEVQS